VICWTIIPIKAPDLCKSRLRIVLDDKKRRALVDSMLRHVVRTAQSARNVEMVMLLNSAKGALLPSIATIPDPGSGLNAVLASTLQTIRADVDRIIIMAADLPTVTQGDIESLAALGARTIGIAIDHLGVGTNALSLPLPEAKQFRPQYGPGSFALHCREAARLALPLRVIRSDGLAFDIDEPSDLDMVHCPFSKAK
jgi:2-phospho-L-lactate guanylyltransferase